MDLVKVKSKKEKRDLVPEEVKHQTIPGTEASQK
jgi:hypothetical protein